MTLRFGAPASPWIVVRLDDRRRLLGPESGGADSILATATPTRLFMSLSAFPTESVGRGDSWREKVPFAVPNLTHDQGSVNVTVTTKVKDVRVVDGDTIVVLGISIRGENRRLAAPPSQSSGTSLAPISTYVRMQGEERFAVGRGATIVLDLRGVVEMQVGVVGGFHMSPIEQEVRVTRRLLVNQ